MHWLATAGRLIIVLYRTSGHPQVLTATIKLHLLKGCPSRGKFFRPLVICFFFFYWKTSLIRCKDAANFRVFGQRMKSLVSKETVGNRTTKITNAKQVEKDPNPLILKKGKLLCSTPSQLTHSASAHTVHFPYVLHVQPLCTLAHTTTVHYRQRCKDLTRVLWLSSTRFIFVFGYRLIPQRFDKKEDKGEKNSNNKNVPITFFIL